jgi:hypothetical protein
MSDDYIYVYDIGNIKFIDLLHEYLLDFFPMTSHSFHINSNQTQINIVFVTELSNNEEGILNNAILDYDPPQNKYNISRTSNIMLSNLTTSSSIYTLIATEFLKYNADESIGYIDIISLVNGTGSYKIRLYDTIHNKLICQTNSLNNNTLQLVRINDINNLPDSDTIIEIQSQVSNPTVTCIIKSIQIVYYYN